MKCEICKKDFSTKISLLRHYNLNHKSSRGKDIEITNVILVVNHILNQAIWWALFAKSIRIENNLGINLCKTMSPIFFSETTMQVVSSSSRSLMYRMVFCIETICSALAYFLILLHLTSKLQFVIFIF